ncbi:hypothetical protein VTO42DRAFT_6763 [Malbranchea cinnamomea]
MASTTRYLSSITRSIASPFFQSVRPSVAPLSFLYPVQQQSRGARTKSKKDTKSKKKRKTFKEYDMKDAIQFSLCDAMRYIRAFEAGRDPKSVKYEVHIKLRTKKDGPILRNQLRLPHAVHTAARVCVICPPGSRAEREAKAAGADIVGQDDVFESIKSGNIDFEACICHPSSLAAMNKAGMGRILGPRGLMPSVKLGTVVDNVGTAVRNMRHGSVYRERSGVVRLAVGQLGFSPDELRKNIRAFISQVKKDALAISDQISKEISEVVLSSTNSPGFSLNGEFKSEQSVSEHILQGP